MIYGIGTDVCEVARVRAALARHGSAFAAKILRPEELLEWQARSARSAERGVVFVASRFAAKEALAKALGTGLRAPMGWQACAVANRPPEHAQAGQPWWVLHGDLARWCAQQGLRLYLSLSDERAVVQAFCIAEIAENTEKSNEIGL